MDATQKIYKAKKELMLNPDWAFFSVLLAGLELQEDENLPSMGTDGVRLFFNPEWVNAVPMLHLISVSAHEALHVALEHTFLRNTAKERGLNFNRVNRACDYAINPIIHNAGLVLPDTALLDPKYAGMSWEAIYPHLTDEEGDNYAADLLPGGGKSAGEQRAGEMGIVPSESGKELLARAYTIGKMMGTLPAGVEELCKAALQPEVDWVEKLHRFVAEQSRSGWSWSKVGRRTFPSIITPAQYSKELGTGVLVLDTSASTKAFLSRFLDEFQSVLTNARPKKLIVMCCDSQVHSVQEFTSDEDVTQYKVSGGGGTSFIPPFEYLKEQGIVPDFLIYMTDLEGRFPEAPAFPVLWMVPKAFGHLSTPFGEKVIYN